MYNINLLPRELRPGNKINRQRLVVKIILIFLAVSLTGAYCGFTYRLHSLQNEVANANEQLVKMRPQVNKALALKQERKRITATVNELQKLLDRRKTWSHVLSDINDILPEDVWLKGINIYYDPGANIRGQLPAREGNYEEKARYRETGKSQKTVTFMQGVAHIPNTITIDGNSRTVPPVGIFLNSLQELKYLKQARLDNILENREQSVITFTITAYTGDSDR